MNLYTSLAVGAALLGSAAAGAAASPNLVTNGSFETPSIVATGTYAWYGHNATAITGWTVVAPGVSVDGSQLTPDTFLGLKASDGRQWIDLTGNYGYDKGLRSDAFATVVGQHYTVSFDVGNLVWNGFGRSTVGLSINGGAEQLFANTSLASTATAPMNWAHFSVDYVATAASTSLTFTGRANDAWSNNAGIGLDNVSVQWVSAVPEPASPALMLVGLAMLGAVMRRSRRRGGSNGRHT